jgi:hypothetical protein
MTEPIEEAPENHCTVVAICPDDAAKAVVLSDIGIENETFEKEYNNDESIQNRAMFTNNNQNEANNQNVGMTSESIQNSPMFTNEEEPTNGGERIQNSATFGHQPSRAGESTTQNERTQSAGGNGDSRSTASAPPLQSESFSRQEFERTREHNVMHQTSEVFAGSGGTAPAIISVVRTKDWHFSVVFIAPYFVLSYVLLLVICGSELSPCTRRF